MIRCPEGMEVQSITFDRDMWTPKQARSWLSGHGYKTPKTDYTKNELRYRQGHPKHYRKDLFKTIPFGDKENTGIQAIVGCPKKSKNPGSVIRSTLP